MLFYYGEGSSDVNRETISVGPLRAEVVDGEIRYITWHDFEVVRRICVGVRDTFWNTIPASIRDWELSRDVNSFRVSFVAENDDGTIDFRWKGTITGDSHGSINFRMDGEALRSFKENRIGLCVLFPIEPCVGRPYRVKKEGEDWRRYKFPILVEPTQPLQEGFSQLEFWPEGEMKVSAKFQGDIFEMEDQRNWSDGSIKAYSTPLSRPFPTLMKRGDRIVQSVSIEIQSIPVAEKSQPSSYALPVMVKPRIPFIGSSYTSGKNLSGKFVGLLKESGLHHLRVDLDLGREDWEQLLKQAAKDASLLGAGLELALTVSGDTIENQLQRVKSQLEKMKRACLTSILAFEKRKFATSSELLRMTERVFSQIPTELGIGGGTDFQFAELNQNRLKGARLLCYPVTPQVHMFDNETLLESLESHRWMIATARSFAPETKLAITPLTLRPRFNTDQLLAAEQETQPENSLTTVDGRQGSLFAAAWTCATLKELFESGIQSVTAYELYGPRGLLGPAPSILDDQLTPSSSTVAYPIFHVLTDLMEIQGKAVLKTKPTENRVGVLGARKGARGRRLMVFNLTDRPQRVSLKNMKSDRVTALRLNEDTVMTAMTKPKVFRTSMVSEERVQGDRLDAQLLPFEVMRIDSE
jgi:D-apionolactonase